VIGFQCYRFHARAITARHLAQSIAIFSAVAMATTYVGFGVFPHPNLTLPQAMGPWIVATIIFLGTVLCKPVQQLRWLNKGALPVLGAMSYSIYLLHPIAGATANAYLARDFQIGGAVALTFVLSWLGYHYVERPGIDLGRAAAAIGKRQPHFERV
jgi:peptidoglycan/LPS O-acetylase OafA/YrhL